MPIEVPCPTCRKKGPWMEWPHGPFCSPRCKLVDLGKWFNEEQRISSPLTPELFEEMADAEESGDRQGP
jgi:endogenous inhibitor of DNA gyrase (YacG/DUF329 family)